jgi:hypothetical protein
MSRADHQADEKKLVEAVATLLDGVPERPKVARAKSQWFASEKRKTDPRSVY